MSTKDDLFHYTPCGLDDVYLEGGVRVEETPYGEAFSLEHANELHDVIAKSIINSARPLRGQEARFLRVMLPSSQEAMAKALGVDRATIFRWERARDKPLSTMQDTAVRMTYASRAAAEEFVVSVIKELHDLDEQADGDAYRQVFETSNHNWREKKTA